MGVAKLGAAGEFTGGTMRLYPTGQQQGRSDGCVCRYVGMYV